MRSFVLLTLSVLVMGVFGCSTREADSNISANVAAEKPKITVSQVTPADASKAIAEGNAQLVDVRTPNEFAAEHARDAVNIPLGSIMDEYSKIDRNKPVYLICESGRRSTEAGIFLKANGYTDVHSVIGGTPAWKADGRPMQE